MTSNQSTSAMAGETYLEAHLAPLRAWLDRDDVSELSVNRPGEIWIEQAGQSAMQRFDVAEITESYIRNLAHLVAGSTRQAVSPETPLLSASLPTGERIQFVLPPAAPLGGAFFSSQACRRRLEPARLRFGRRF